MLTNDLIELASKKGVTSAFISPDQIPVDASFRTFCEENRCGKYNANYSCPPDSGTVEEMHHSILEQEQVMVLEMILEGVAYDDMPVILESRKKINYTVIRMLEYLRTQGYDGIAAGYGGCPLCTPCKRTLNEPCAFPDKKTSCLSAYCINVGELAKRCELPFAWEPDKLYLFGLVAYHKI